MILLNDTWINTSSGPLLIRAGDQPSDPAVIAGLSSYGGILWPATDPVVLAAANLVVKYRSRAADERWSSDTMLAAASQSMLSGSAGVSQNGAARTVRLATAAALAANTFLAVAGGADTITINATGTLTVDGVLTALGDRILVANEGTATHNGIYTVTTAGATGVAAVLTRATDSQASISFLAGMEVYTGPEGTSNANATFQLVTTPPIVLDTTSLTYVKTASALEGAGALATFTKAAADGAASTATAETIIGMIGPSSGGNVGTVFFVPAAALTADNSNNAVITVFKRTAGGAAVQVAAATTNVAGTGSWTQWKPVSIPVTAAAVSASDALTYTITKNGTGVVVPAGQLNVYAS
jgi:hypothetical protein